MQSALYVGLSAQVALEKRLQTIANNVANVNTAAFRTDAAAFVSWLENKVDAALFSAIESTVRQTDHRRIERLPLHINDPKFAEAAVAAFREITSR